MLVPTYERPQNYAEKFKKIMTVLYLINDLESLSKNRINLTFHQMKNIFILNLWNVRQIIKQSL